MLQLSQRLARTALAASALAATLAVSPLQDSAPKGPEVGKPAPTFRLNDQDGKAVSIGSASEAWRVVAFYPKAKTPG